MSNILDDEEDKIDNLHERLRDETQRQRQMELKVTNMTQKMTEIENKLKLLMEQSELQTQRTQSEFELTRWRQQEMQLLMQSQFEHMMGFLQKGLGFQVSSPVERVLQTEPVFPIKIESELANIITKSEPFGEITPFERFFMGVGNHFFKNQKDQLLFPKYKPKMKKERKQHLKDYIWIPSTELLTYYNEIWLPLEAPKERSMNLNIFCSKLKKIGSEMNPSPKDYSSLTLSRVRHLPIDWKYWHGRAQELGFDENYTVNVNKLSKSIMAQGKRSPGQDSIETILNENMNLGEI